MGVLNGKMGIMESNMETTFAQGSRHLEGFPKLGVPFLGVPKKGLYYFGVSVVPLFRETTMRGAAKDWGSLFSLALGEAYFGVHKGKPALGNEHMGIVS